MPGPGRGKEPDPSPFIHPHFQEGPVVPSLKSLSPDLFPNSEFPRFLKGNSVQTLYCSVLSLVNELFCGEMKEYSH